MYEDTVVKAIDIINKAVAEENKEDYEAAYNSYIHAINLFNHYLKYGPKNQKIQDTITEKVCSYLDRAEELKIYLKEKKNKEAVPSGDNGPKAKNDETDESKRLKNQLRSAIALEKPNVKWDDVAGLETAKQALMEAVILPLKFPHAFTANRRPWRGILLFGPPGTGKSYLAKAVATEAGNSTFISLSSSDIVSKWLGESEKLVREAFELARENKPAIIFIDEIDSLCSARNESENESARRIKTEFLVQMEGVGQRNDNSNILVLGATNMPWVLDGGIRRRFEKRIYIPLPDEPARIKLFQKHVGATQNTLKYNDFAIFASMTDGYSGADISIIVREALMEPIRKVQTSTHFKLVSGPSPTDPNVVVKDLYTPCLPSDKKGFEMKWMDIPDDKLLLPFVSSRDILKAISRIRPTVSPDECEKLIKFSKEFGGDL